LETTGAKDQRLFKPFVIRMADGREVEFRHPDAVDWEAEAPRKALCVLPGGDAVWIELALVTDLAEAPPATKKRRRT
jgi:hypothetical protein